ncbi:MAG: NADPH-dependent 7-cyano-7-deazaguanine reductase QueF [Dehalococcoidales bacterium]|nr:NADPH-dependent 7-cyano-7-deazaguanine reductase QueF [Dehalococcoidales bacterium]
MENNKYGGKRYDIHDETAIDTDILEAIPFDYPESATEVVYETDEFTCVCPWTGLPDFGTLTVSYMPENSLIELKSLKYYLTSYRNVGIIQEHVVNRILDDLVALVNPVTMMVEAEYRERGGIRTEASAVYEREDPDDMDDLDDLD